MLINVNNLFQQQLTTKKIFDLSSRNNGKEACQKKKNNPKINTCVICSLYLKIQNSKIRCMMTKIE